MSNTEVAQLLNVSVTTAKNYADIMELKKDPAYLSSVPFPVVKIESTTGHRTATLQQTRLQLPFLLRKHSFRVLYNKIIINFCLFFLVYVIQVLYICIHKYNNKDYGSSN